MHFHGKGVDDDFGEALRWCVGLFHRVYFVTFCACTSLQASRVIQKRAGGCRCATQGAGASLSTKMKRRDGGGCDPRILILLPFFISRSRSPPPSPPLLHRLTCCSPVTV
jgi:hypothetical protein